SQPDQVERPEVRRGRDEVRRPPARIVPGQGAAAGGDWPRLRYVRPDDDGLDRRRRRFLASADERLYHRLLGPRHAGPFVASGRVGRDVDGQEGDAPGREGARCECVGPVPGCEADRGRKGGVLTPARRARLQADAGEGPSSAARLSAAAEAEGGGG